MIPFIWFQFHLCDSIYLIPFWFHLFVSIYLILFRNEDTAALLAEQNERAEGGSGDGDGGAISDKPTAAPQLYVTGSQRNPAYPNPPPPLFFFPPSPPVGNG
jgi:hypothetical protein